MIAILIRYILYIHRKNAFRSTEKMKYVKQRRNLWYNRFAKCAERNFLRATSKKKRIVSTTTFPRIVALEFSLLYENLVRIGKAWGQTRKKTWNCFIAQSLACFPSSHSVANTIMRIRAAYARRLFGEWIWHKFNIQRQIRRHP